MQYVDREYYTHCNRGFQRGGATQNVKLGVGVSLAMNTIVPFKMVNGRVQKFLEIF